jgi:hypothetical protein
MWKGLKVLEDEFLPLQFPQPLGNTPNFVEDADVIRL